MPYTFITPNNEEIELERSFWSGKTTVMLNGKTIEPTEKKRLGGISIYTLPSGKLEIKPSSFDPAPKVTLNGQPIQIVPPLQWWQYIVAGLPLLVIFLGGAIPALVGFGALFVNYSIMRSERPLGVRIAICIAIFIAAIVVAFLISFLVISLLNL